MDNFEFYVWSGVIIVLLIILFIAYKRYSVVDPSAACINRGPGNYIQVTYNQKPLLVRDAWFLDNIGKIKAGIVDIYASMGSSMCKANLLPMLDQLAAGLEENISSMGSDGMFCSNVNDYLNRKGPGYDMWVQMKSQMIDTGKSSLLGMTRSDTDLQSRVDAAFNNIIASLDGIIDVIASKSCTIDGKVNLDYLHNIINQLRLICDYDAQAAIALPIVDLGEKYGLDTVLTANACPQVSANAVTQSPPKSAAFLPKRQQMMRQIDRESVNGGSLNERSNGSRKKSAQPIAKIPRTARKMAMRNMIKSG